MSNESDGSGGSGDPDGSGRSDDIVIIKQLLQKLEEAAARDAETPRDEPSSEAPVREGLGREVQGLEGPPLLVLRSNRSGASANPLPRGDGEPAGPLGMPEFRRTPISIDLRHTDTALAMVPRDAPPARRRPGYAVAALSFVLGIAAAGGLIVVFDPFGQRGGGGTGVARAPSVQAPSSPQNSPAENARPVLAPVDVAASGVPDNVTTEASAVKPEPPYRETTIARAPEIVQAPATQSSSGSDKFGLRVASRIELNAGERRFIDVRVEAPASEAQRLLVVFRQVPVWITFSKGGAIGNDIWLLPAQQVRDLEVEINDGADGAADVKVQLAKVDGSILSETSVSFVAASPRPPAVTAGVAPGGNEATILRLQARGELLLDTGEVEAARTLLRTAAEAGSVAAALRLAETYDPAEIQRLGMAERSADLGMAVRWYEHAHALGSPVAAARLVALGRR